MLGYTPIAGNCKEIRILTLEPGERSSPIKCTLSHIQIDADIYYEVVTMILEDGGEQSVIEVNHMDHLVSKDLVKVLSHLRLKTGPRNLWIDTLCVNERDQTEKINLVNSLKLIHTSAKCVLIWAGEDCENIDFMDVYLGKGSHSSTEYALDFARILNGVEIMEIDSVLQQKLPKTGLHGWPYFLRIIYRPWYRRLPILRKNYLIDLQCLKVLCGSSSILWSDIQTAAERIRIAQPTPHFLLNAKPEIENRFEILEADCLWLQTSSRFGFSLSKLVAQILWLVNQVKGTTQRDRLMALLGREETLIQGFPLHDIHKHHDALLAGNGDLALDVTELREIRPAPSLPFEGRMSPAPVLEEQAAFVHLSVNRGTKIPLLVLLPHFGDPTSIIQCGLVQTDRANPRAFSYVLNASLKNPRMTTLILVNGQSFRIPRAMEIFFRHIRDFNQEQALFVWKICMHPFEIDVSSIKDLENYFQIKAFLLWKASDTIDMYDELELAVRAEGAIPSNGMTADDWLLELND